jgi:hypothetical protein
MTAQKLPNNALDDPNPNMRRRVVEVLNQLSELLPAASESWTPVIFGASTAGTYEVGVNRCRYTRIGPRVYLDVYVQLAGTITGGGAGGLRIRGFPFPSRAETYPVGAILLSGVNWAAGANLTVAFETAATSSSSLVIQETNDTAANTTLAISALDANDLIIASICYETDAP